MEEGKVYNSDTKKEFLVEHSEASQKTYKWLFQKSSKMEMIAEQELFNFSFNQIGILMSDYLQPNTINTARAYGRLISSYLNWACKKGFNKENILKKTNTDYFDQYVGTENKIYFSEEEIDEMVNKLVNAQDSVIIRLLFEGIEGDALSELLNLKINDAAEDTIHVEGRGHRVKVTEKCMSLVNRAIREDTYLLRNGEAKGKKKEAALVDNNYLIKSAIGKTINLEKADKHLVYRRIAMISEYFDYKYLNAKNIRKSGMIKMAKDLYARDGELDKKQLGEIAEQFGIKKVKMGKYEFHNYTMIKDFVNMENIRLLYSI